MSSHQDQSSDWSKNSAICSPNGSIGLGLCFYLQTLGCKSRERNHGKLCLDKPCGMHSLSKLSISVRLSVILLPFVPPNGLFPLGKRCWYAFFPEPVLQYEAGFIILLYFNQIIVYSSYLIWGLYLLLLYFSKSVLILLSVIAKVQETSYYILWRNQDFKGKDLPKSHAFTCFFKISSSHSWLKNTFLISWRVLFLLYSCFSLPWAVAVFPWWMNNFPHE